MGSRTWISRAAAGVGIGLLVLGLSVAVGQPAGALPLPPGDDWGGDDGGSIYTTRRIQSFDVRTDSVVATATIVYSGDPGAATVVWGDGTSTSRCLPGQEGPLYSGCLPAPYSSSQPNGVLVFKHSYAAPGDGANFTARITAKLGGESQTVAIGVTPRYRVTGSDVRFSPLNHCDNVLEQYTEWKVWRVVQNELTTTTVVPLQEWRFDRLTQPGAVVGGSLPVFEPIPGSGFSVELKASDRLSVGYHATEIDPVSDHSLPTVFAGLLPLWGDRSVILNSEETFQVIPDAPCRVEYRFDIDVELLRPGLDQGPVATQ